jgi:hypothetical protein
MSLQYERQVVPRYTSCVQLQAASDGGCRGCPKPTELQSLSIVGHSLAELLRKCTPRQCDQCSSIMKPVVRTLMKMMVCESVRTQKVFKKKPRLMESRTDEQPDLNAATCAFVGNVVNSISCVIIKLNQDQTITTIIDPVQYRDS